MLGSFWEKRAKREIERAQRYIVWVWETGVTGPVVSLLRLPVLAYPRTSCFRRRLGHEKVKGAIDWLCNGPLLVQSLSRLLNYPVKKAKLKAARKVRNKDLYRASSSYAFDMDHFLFLRGWRFSDSLRVLELFLGLLLGLTRKEKKQQDSPISVSDAFQPPRNTQRT